jgi:hypothetical protein
MKLKLSLAGVDVEDGAAPIQTSSTTQLSVAPLTHSPPLILILVSPSSSSS